jgi:hypothetical protein
MKKRLNRKVLLPSLFSIVIVTVFVLDSLTAVRPAWPPVREGDPVPQRPTADSPTFHRTPLAQTFEERRQLFLEYAASQPTSPDRGGIWVELAKLETGQDFLAQETLQDALDFVNARHDTADFTMVGLVRLYYKYADSGQLTPEQSEGIRRAMLDFQYWLDEPNPSLMELWTENHQILIHSSEYLAAQLFPDEVFTNTGQTGRQRIDKARSRVLEWIDWRARTGFAEWDSVPYNNMNIAAVLNLAEYSADPEIARLASHMVDVLLFDMAVDSYYGHYATSHGRAAARHIKSAAGDSLVTVQALAWGLGRFQSTDMASVFLATGSRYAVPPILEKIAQDMPEEMLNYERHSIPLTREAAAEYGLSFEDPEDFHIWWGMGAFTQPEIINLTIHIADTWQMWNYPDFKDLKDLAGVLKTFGLLPTASKLLNPDPNGTLTSEVNKVTFRTPDGSLSNAQDYRKGEKGYQQHIWQATLDPYAVVFVTNPDSMREDDRHRPSYWASHGRLPRTAQYRNVLVSLFNIDRRPSPSILEARHYAFTHAYFPRWAFDRVEEVPAPGGGGWIFGQRGKGYVGLYSHLPYDWQEEGPDAGQEIIALGRQNVWLAMIGREAVDGSFEEFISAVAASPVKVRGLQVEYQAPGAGLVKFGWEGPLTVDGQVVPLRDYPRFDNPYARLEFGEKVYRISFEGEELVLDFNLRGPFP